MCLSSSSGAAGGGGSASRWIAGVMLGEIAFRLLLCEGARVVLGRFVLLGAPLIAVGIVHGGSGELKRHQRHRRS
jgi:hypothetical protein